MRMKFFVLLYLINLCCYEVTFASLLQDIIKHEAEDGKNVDESTTKGNFDPDHKEDKGNLVIFDLRTAVLIFKNSTHILIEKKDKHKHHHKYTTTTTREFHFCEIIFKLFF